jgi:hypothetical protein
MNMIWNIFFVMTENGFYFIELTENEKHQTITMVFCKAIKIAIEC